MNERGWDYSKIQEPCFVCQAEDRLGELRGTQSHPINCGWKVGIESKIRERALERIINLCDDVNNVEHDELIIKIKNIATTSLTIGYNKLKEELR
jgi:hypothetical protein